MSLETFRNLPDNKQKVIIDKGIEVFSKVYCFIILAARKTFIFIY